MGEGSNKYKCLGWGRSLAWSRSMEETRVAGPEPMARDEEMKQKKG